MKPNGINNWTAYKDILKRVPLFFLLLNIPIGLTAQDQEDASLYLEEYSDDFQEAFFSALQQKGIRNYDRAIRELEKCLALRPDQAVVYHELARNYFLDRQYNRGLSFAIKAVDLEPTNYWYTETYYQFQSRKGRTRPKELASDLPAAGDGFWTNLTEVYRKRGLFTQALASLDMVSDQKKASTLRDQIREEQESQRRAVQAARIVQESAPKRKNSSESAESPLYLVKKSLQELQQEGDFNRLYKESSEAVESYPLQPDFYYYQGWALLKNGKPKEATGILEESLAYLLEEGELSLLIYQALAEAYELLGDANKLRYYQKKLNGNNPQ